MLLDVAVGFDYILLFVVCCLMNVKATGEWEVLAWCGGCTAAILEKLVINSCSYCCGCSDCGGNVKTIVCSVIQTPSVRTLRCAHSILATLYTARPSNLSRLCFSLQYFFLPCLRHPITKRKLIVGCNH